MAGLIQANMPSSVGDETNEKEPVEGVGLDGSAQHEGMEGEAPESGDNSQEITSGSVRSQMKLPNGLEAAYDKIIKAGLKVMFDPTMRDDTLSFIEESQGDPAKMAEGVSSVVITLWKESNETLPPTLIIPAGIELMVHAAEVAKSGGMQVDNQLLAEAMAQTVQQLLVKFGATPQEMQQLMSGANSGEKVPTPTPTPGEPA